MISAIKHRKTDHKAIEDTLTSSVFDNLLSLPDDIFWKIIKDSCFSNNSLPKNINRIDSYEFWPHWDAENTTNENLVEPDLFIRFDSFDLIIEAKRGDGNQQYEEQWRNQFISYNNEYKEDNQNVILLAIGGINSKREEKISIENDDLKIVVKCSWEKILGVLNDVLENLKCNEYINTNYLIRIVKTTINALELHGYLDIKWFKDFKNNYNIRYDNSFKTIDKWEISNG